MNEKVALTPPMGWNSWDCYGASVTEAEVKGNAEYMAEYLKPFGWEYIVVDIQWYEPQAKTSAYNPFVPLELDEYSRLVPAVNRFPSADHGKGFKPLADYLHGLGLKFGIHILRGIPRQAVHANTAILGTEIRARAIAHPNSICPWNTDMYGVDPARPGAQAYYNSLFQLYASWNVDYVKVDDIAAPYNCGEIELISRAIANSGREMVLSLSPGPAPLEQAERLMEHANMWRMTGDFWDRWEDLSAEFERCRQWSSYAGPGHWPDADMLPLGHIGIRSCEHGVGDRWTRFSKNEQLTMVTLWCIFRSPLMFGGELRDNDDWTLSLLTNAEVLRVLNHSHSGRQLFRNGLWDQHIAWTARDEDGSYYLAVFNTGTLETRVEIMLDRMNLSGPCRVRDLWKRQDLEDVTWALLITIPSHGARLFKLNPIL
ncbi:MAG TPA: glycoside hydrolase family 27 protein [Bacillota bacterium]